MEISLVFRVHPSEDALEEYAFGRLNGAPLCTVEEHLLVCGVCRMALEHTEQYIRLVKTAAALVPAERRHALLTGVWDSLRARMRAPAVAWTGVLASACVVAFILLTPRFPPAPVTVSLQSYRGDASLHGEDSGINLAPALRLLDLSIRAEDVPRKPAYRMEVVADDGRALWAGGAETTQQQLTAHMTRKLNAGHYWVRLYDQDSVLLSEFGLRLR